MTLRIDPNTISYSLIKNAIISYVKNKPDGESWKDFLNSSAGNTYIDTLAGTSSFLNFNAVTSRRETYLNYAKNRTSAIAISESNMSYNTSRGSNPRIQLVVISSETVSINKWDIVGSLGDYQLISMDTVILYSTIPTVIECVVGNLITNITYDLNSSETDVFRIITNGMSDDVRMLFRKTNLDEYIDLDKEQGMSTRITDLTKDKYVLLTNPYDSVDVYYLNNRPNLLNVGDEVRLTTSGSLPSPLQQNTPYYIIPRGENLISLALLEIDAFNDVPINITSVGSGIHLINSMYSFTLDGYDDDQINPTGLTTDILAVNGIFPKYKYSNGSTFRFDYIELANPIFDLVDVEFFYGIVQYGDSRTKVLRPYIAPEKIGNIKINAPMRFETQFIIKGREDFPKILRLLDNRFVDTNGNDLSPAIVEVTYLKDDYSILTKDEKFDLITKLNSYRPFGIAPAQIVDPKKVNYKLSISLRLYTGVVIPDIEQELQNVMSVEPIENEVIILRENNFQYILNLYQLEHEINNLLNSDNERYIQVSRVNMYTESHSINTSYKRGDFVTHSSSLNYMFECVRVFGDLLIPFTSDFCNINYPTYLTSTSHGLVTGQAVKLLRTGVGLLPAPLSEENIYYVINRNVNEFSLSLTPDGQDVRLIDNGSGISGVNNIISGKVFTTNYSPTPIGNQNLELTFSTSHGLNTNDPVQVFSDKVLPSPLSENITYYVEVVSPTVIYLKTLETEDPLTYSDPITLTDNGTSGSIKTLHNGILQGYSGSTTPLFGTASPTVTEFIDGNVIWKAVLKTDISFGIGWNEFLKIDFEYDTDL